MQTSWSEKVKERGLLTWRTFRNLKMLKNTSTKVEMLTSKKAEMLKNSSTNIKVLRNLREYLKVK